LSGRFDELFSTVTGYDALDQRDPHPCDHLPRPRSSGFRGK